MYVKCFHDIQRGEDKEVMIDGDNETSNVVRNVVKISLLVVMNSSIILFDDENPLFHNN